MCHLRTAPPGDASSGPEGSNGEHRSQRATYPRPRGPSRALPFLLVDGLRQWLPSPSPPPMDLRDKVAVVTGASRGLGRAFSEALVERGARVFGLARSEEDLAEVREALGDAFIPVPCDVTDREAVDAAFDRVEREAGRCDVLLNNAGLGQFGAIEELEEQQW
jgi:hypothetical protein